MTSILEEFVLGWETLGSLASVSLPFFVLFLYQVAERILGLSKVHFIVHITICECAYIYRGVYTLADYMHGAYLLCYSNYVGCDILGMQGFISTK